MNISLLVIIGLLFTLAIFWNLYQSYSKQRLRRRLKDIHRKS